MQRSDTLLQRLRHRVILGYHQATLSWQAQKEGRGRAIRLRRNSEFVQVHDGTRQLYVPDLRHARRLSGGVNERLEQVAAKYLGGTGYVPREGDVILDIGAGIGEFTLWCADAGARVVAFEPDPAAFGCLERNAGSLEGVQLFPLALWKERADLQLHCAPERLGSSLIEDGSGSGPRADVEAWPLDALQVVVRLPVIDFMKLDGEGVEPEILAGGMRTLRRTRVIAVDLGATERRPNLRARVEGILDSLSFRPLAQDRTSTILALNTAMVGPFSNRVLDRRYS